MSVIFVTPVLIHYFLAREVVTVVVLDVMFFLASSPGSLPPEITAQKREGAWNLNA